MSGMRDGPITRTPEGASETGVPDITTAGPPAVMVVPARVMAAAEGGAAKVTPWTENSRGEGACGGERAMLEGPTTRVPERARDTGVPPTVIAGSPGASVEPATTILPGSTGTAFPATAFDVAAPGTDSMIMPAVGSSETTCPSTVAGSPFTKITFPPTGTTEGVSTVIVCPAAGEMIALVGPGDGSGFVVFDVLCPGTPNPNALKIIPPRSGMVGGLSAGALTADSGAAPLGIDESTEPDPGGFPEMGGCPESDGFPEPGEFPEPGGLPGPVGSPEPGEFPGSGDLPGPGW